MQEEKQNGDKQHPAAEQQPLNSMDRNLATAPNDPKQSVGDHQSAVSSVQKPVMSPQECLALARRTPRRQWKALMRECTEFARIEHEISVDMVGKKFNLGTAAAYRIMRMMSEAGAITKKQGRIWKYTPTFVAKPLPRKKRRGKFALWHEHMPVAIALANQKQGLVSQKMLAMHLAVSAGTSLKILTELEKTGVIGRYDKATRKRLPTAQVQQIPEAFTLPQEKKTPNDSCEFLKRLRDSIGPDSKTGRRLGEVIIEITALRAFKAKLSNL